MLGAGKKLVPAIVAGAGLAEEKPRSRVRRKTNTSEALETLLQRVAAMGRENRADFDSGRTRNGLYICMKKKESRQKLGSHANTPPPLDIFNVNAFGNKD